MVFGFLKKKWISWAYKNAKREHDFGRLQFAPNLIGIGFVLFVLYKCWSIILSRYVFGFILLTQVTTFLFQLIYLLSHTMEKFCFKQGGGGSRG